MPCLVLSLGTGSPFGRWMRPLRMEAQLEWTYSSARLHLRMWWPFWLQKAHPSERCRVQKNELGSSKLEVEVVGAGVRDHCGEVLGLGAAGGAWYE